MADFPAFLRDHADAERKASAMAMSMIAKYPNRTEIIPLLIETAVEELEHFRDVYAIMEKQGIQLVHSMPADPYIKKLLKRMHSGIEEQFLDRMLIASVVEVRGGERFRLVAENIDDPDLAKFYKELWACEAKHGNIYVEMALNYFDEKKVYDRLEYWVDQEADVLESLELRAAVH
jgi:tRNA-(ms[2]io[6]A)-hydroxylase